MTGTDTEGDVESFQFTFTDDGGADVPYDDGSGSALTDMDSAFAWGVDGQTSFTAYADLYFADPFVGDLTPAGSEGIRVELVDAGENQSGSMTDAWDDIGSPDTGEACDPVGFADMCGEGETCPLAAPTCQDAADAATALCGAAIPELVAGAVTPVFATPPATFYGGIFVSTCGGGGPEQVFRLVVGARSSIELNTDLAGSEEADSSIHVRSDCADDGSEIACNEDIDEVGGNYRSQLTIDAAEPGTYYVFADNYGSALPYNILATVTPL